MEQNNNEKKDLSKDEAGLTLLEIVIVVVLIGIVATVVAQNLIGQSEAVKAEANVVQMQKIKSLLGQYRLKYSTYPDKLQDLTKASPKIKDSGKLFFALADEKDLKDVWGSEYIYKSESNGRSYSITSLGSDGAEGGEGPKQDVTLKP